MATRAPVTLAIRGPLRPADLPGLYARVCLLLHAAGPGEIACDVAGVPVDAVAVEALARLQLGARRSGCRVRLENASAELLQLVVLLGLADVLPA